MGILGALCVLALPLNSLLPGSDTRKRVEMHKRVELACPYLIYFTVTGALHC